MNNESLNIRIPLINEMLDLSRSIAASLFEGRRYAWEVLGDISDFILKLGPTLSADEFFSPRENVWIAKDATVFDSAYIAGPCIIDRGAEIRHCAFIRGSVIVGKNATVGNSVELKNSVLFDDVEVPHYNYVGDSILGHHAHMGAGSITSNVKADRKNIVVHGEDDIETGRRKFGAILGDYAEIGCNAVLNPGSVIGAHTSVYPALSFRGVAPNNCIVKSSGAVAERK